MALLKFFLGNSSDLANIPPIDGYLYFCTDNSNFYIDCYDPVQGAVVRKVVGGETFATQEWVENYIANNMPTYPKAEEAEF